MIDQVEVLNFRSVLGRGPDDSGDPVRLEVEEDITTLIGQNEAGKSNVLDAINQFGKSVPLSDTKISNYRDYPDPKDELEILRCRLSSGALDRNSEQVKSVPWLLGPYRSEDLDGFPVRETLEEMTPIQPADGGDSRSEDNSIADEAIDGAVLPLGEVLATGRIEVVHYASGDHAIDIVDSTDVSGSSDTSSIRDQISFPMDLDEFLSQRYDEYLRLCQWFVSNIVEVADLNPEIEEITALNRDAVADKSDLRVQLTDRLESISQAFGDAEPIDEPPVETQDEAEFELPKISVIQKLANDLLRTLSNIDSPPNRIEDLPNIVDQSKINLADSEYDLRADEDNPVLRGLFALNNINLEDYSSLDSPEFRKSLDTAVEQLSLYLNWFWDSDPTGRQPIETVTPEETDSYRFEYELHEGTITLKLAEDETPPTPLEQRSDGMRWIITFLLTIIAQPYAQSGGRQTLVTLDDPGIHLHPEAEKQLFRAFFNVTNQAQIIYTTHSPALIDRKEVDRLRIVKNITEKKDSSLIGTRIANDLDDARTPGEQVDPLATAREAIGWTLSDSLFRGEQTVLVEGPSDKRYLNLFNDYFKWDGKPHLDKDPTFVDSKGGQLPFLSRILSAEDVHHVILMDDDSVNNGYEAEIEARTVRYTDVEIPDSREYEAEIEDLFDREFLIKAAAEVHDELDAEEALEPPYHTFECSIVSYIEEYLEETEDHSGELCKYDLSMEVKDQLEKELRTSPEEHSETIERFQSVISELKEKIEKMDDE